MSPRKQDDESGQVPGDGLQVVDRDAPIFVISVAAKLSGMHPQTLRSYDRMGLVQPRRTSGRGRRYSPRDVSRLRLIQRLSQDEGINLQGIRRILELEAELEELREHASELTELLRLAHSAPAGSRLFTADQVGGVHLTPAQRRYARRNPPRQLGR
ncbi:heat shock protein transcriptional repressor HspR [Enemella evansiae]|uniref:MerR family transcriptional regulator n=1 Tax=Enemella evansiae TaxID=2016499 RepID=A0A255GPL1_9ACTN|nr:MerR family transcriptional regulator [Enemella evansiae]PFG68839.1 MerR family transcriptional regulator/heat shock protein HspR [Propionibacteriaceae bacterium ES.041]OYN97039.1 MerR family transcriptional regulator [Enemella evansiae]OYO00526.1 MerR family transcriptional regulator [Enemella evansiae]OYO06119.1 MerR family transcriptional regulator [Enemella evansiae]OYO13851.1 MerR family transcriptional regulator [Enemella evansiae]